MEKDNYNDRVQASTKHFTRVSENIVIPSGWIRTNGQTFWHGCAIVITTAGLYSTKSKPSARSVSWRAAYGLL